MQPVETNRATGVKLWVPVVLIAGVLVGILLSTLPSPTGGRWPGRGPAWALRFETAADVDVVLSTVSVALLVALVVVYAKTYRVTRASFAFGLTVVLCALAVETVLTSPLVYGAFGEAAGGLATYLLLANVFKIGAFTALLYLSLQ